MPENPQARNHVGYPGFLDDVPYEIAPPCAGAMIESLRGVGYTCGTAVADLIDNSISAGARNVWLDFQYTGSDSTVTILDDGRGMSLQELRRAMTLGGVSPLAVRAPGDLGRFGLGLKTASFSQCRSLTVFSKQIEVVNVRRWDLDYITRPDVGDWRLLSAARPGSESAGARLASLPHGTLVLWQGLDRVVGAVARDDRAGADAFYSLAAQVERHLGMVFHRFLEGPSPDLRIFIGGNRIRAWDPFLRANLATDATPVDTIGGTGGMVELEGFVLPHKDQLTQDAYVSGGGPEGWTAQQGFYVYRDRRMLVSGSWLGLGHPRIWTTEEPYKLARLRLEFSNSADFEWDIDVKKSVARPPRWLRPRLMALAERVRDDARRVFAHRGAYGRRAPVADLQAAWTVHPSGGATAYRINRAHPAITRAFEDPGRDCIEQALRIVEETVPVQRIWLDTVENGEAPNEAFRGAPAPEVEALARSMLAHLTVKVGLARAAALYRLRTTEPFQNFPAVLEILEAEAE